MGIWSIEESEKGGYVLRIIEGHGKGLYLATGDGDMYCRDERSQFAILTDDIAKADRVRFIHSIKDKMSGSQGSLQGGDAADSLEEVFIENIEDQSYLTVRDMLNGDVRSLSSYFVHFRVNDGKATK